MKSFKKIAVLTSGGDSPGLNACIRAVVRAAAYHDIEVMGIHGGYEGLIEGDFQPMDLNSVNYTIQKAGTLLKSSRSERFRTPEGREIAYRNLQTAGIEAVILIGGDGSLSGSKSFTMSYPDIPWIGIPKTIDNDVSGTDYTIGFDTATNTAMEAIDKIRDTAESHNRIYFVEVMGRNAGFLAYKTGISVGAEAIYIPETKTDLESLFSKLENGWNRKKGSMIVVVAEGDEAGGAFEISKKVKERFPQFDMAVSVLGYIQRGGSPSCADRVLASKLGVAAIDTLLSGQRNVMVGEVKGELLLTPLEEVKKRNIEITESITEMIQILSS